MFKNRMLWHVSECVFYSPLLETLGDFPLTFPMRTCRVPGSKMTKVGSLPMTGPPCVFSLRFVHTEPPATHQLQLWGPYPGMCFCPQGLLSYNWMSLSTVLGGAAGCPVIWHLTHLRGVVGCSLLSFLLVRMEWPHPSFLHAGLETHEFHF